MKLYYVVGSPNCRKVHAVVNHLNIDVEFEYLDFFAGDLKAPDYLGINPNGMVPALRDNGFTLSESTAIMQYLADKTPGNTLFPQAGGVRKRSKARGRCRSGAASARLSGWPIPQRHSSAPFACIKRVASPKR